ncbi:ribonuclease HI [Chitinophaga agrisoli]|uniref:ribonuclease H n=1 Tax=Chitinophaga agrisoli TaxID=2607653 RepID=A0A5B2VHH6_9BACT|nr:ribonuclease H [Chitinophaga agrisoli]KAA2238405.1 ribonuclease HI [Chitinophaga agrisoli]
MLNSAELYTDGSCNTQNGLGAWVAILLSGGEKTILSGTTPDTTHNRMELYAVIAGIRHAEKAFTSIRIFSDSQYVTGLMARKEKLTAAGFITSKGTELRNADLVRELYALSTQIELTFIKVKAHQKQGPARNFNIEADKLVRKIMRDTCME